MEGAIVSKPWASGLAADKRMVCIMPLQHPQWTSAVTAVRGDCSTGRHTQSIALLCIELVFY